MPSLGAAQRTSQNRALTKKNDGGDEVMDLFFRIIIDLFFVWPFKAIVALHRWANRPRIAAFKPPKPLGRPATPAEKQRAVNELRLAQKQMDEAYNLGEPFDDTSWEYHVKNAAVAIEKAKSLDPTASLLIEGKDYKHTHTIDDFSAEVLYMEALGYKYLHRSGFQPLNLRGWISGWNWQNKILHYALTAIDKALIYRPRSADFLRLKAEMLIELGRRKEAAAVLDEALAFKPDDLEAMQMRRNLG